MQFSFFILAAFTFQTFQSTKITDRQIYQDGGTWLINYTFNKNIYDKPEIIIDGWVSNSRVPNNSTSRHLILDDKPCCILFDCVEDERRCTAKFTSEVNNNTIKIKITHQHGIYGNLNPLMGSLKVKIKFDGNIVYDSFNLHEKNLFYPDLKIEIPLERMDKRYSINRSSLGSLHLEANIPNVQFYRFPEILVRCDSRIKFSFWYLIATRTEGECFIWLTQYKDTPSSWRKLDDSAVRKKLTTIGKWKKVEYVFRTEKEATTMLLEFKIAGDSDIGEMWVDCIEFKYLDKKEESGP